MDPYGRIEKVVGARELRSKLAAKASPHAKMILNGLLDEENLKRVVTLAGGLPDKPVKVGETWLVQRDMPMGPMVPLWMDAKYTFKGWEEHDERRCALIECQARCDKSPGKGSEADCDRRCKEHAHSVIGSLWSPF